MFYFFVFKGLLDSVAAGKDMISEIQTQYLTLQL